MQYIEDGHSILYLWDEGITMTCLKDIIQYGKIKDVKVQLENVEKLGIFLNL